ncbi:MAG: hypothetical protein PWQ77_1982 [Kosmotogales bacterium]|nr:hypothetical protein [Kosmotogales bacterium]
MAFTIISDESGDNGIKFNKGSSEYKVVSSLLINDKDIGVFYREILTLYKKFLNNQKIQKWTYLNSKKRIEQFEGFFLGLLNIKKPFFLISLVLIEKHYYSSSKEINAATVESYECIFKRIIPFLKKVNYVTNNKILKEISWYIDKSSDRYFINELKKSITYTKNNGFSLLNFKFLNKPCNINKQNEKKIAYLISFVDLIAGITNKLFEKYYSNLHSNSQYSNNKFPCGEKFIKFICEKGNFDCTNITNCTNIYIKVWDYIRQTLNQKISYNSKTIWDWGGLFFLPSYIRSSYEHIIGKDSYFK